MEIFAENAICRELQCADTNAPLGRIPSEAGLGVIKLAFHSPIIWMSWCGVCGAISAREWICTVGLSAKDLLQKELQHSNANAPTAGSASGIALGAIKLVFHPLFIWVSCCEDCGVISAPEWICAASISAKDSTEGGDCPNGTKWGKGWIRKKTQQNRVSPHRNNYRLGEWEPRKFQNILAHVSQAYSRMHDFLLRKWKFQNVIFHMRHQAPFENF